MDKQITPKIDFELIILLNNFGRDFNFSRF